MIRLHAAALLAFPRGFRIRYREELAAAYRGHCLHGGASRIWAIGVRGAHGILEAMVEGWRERTHQRRHRPSLRSPEHPATPAVVLTQLAGDVRYALRSFVKTPGFSLTVLGVLAIGVGSATAVFSIVDSLVLTGAPFPRSDELVTIAETYRPDGGNVERRPASYLDYRDWRENTTAFSRLAIRDFQSVTVTEPDAEPARLGAAFVSLETFSVFGVSPAAGRLFVDEDDVPSARVAVVSHDLWDDRYHRDPGVVGRRVMVNEVPVVVVGVAAAGYGGPFGGVDLWLPFKSEGAYVSRRPAEVVLEDRGQRAFTVLGRLRSGVSIDVAQREIDRVTAALHDNGSLPPERGAVVLGFEAEFFSAAQRTVLLIFGTVALVLLIACINVANLVLVRQIGRNREMALRRALGAGSGVLVRQLLAESITLSLAGGALGVVCALWLTDVLAAANLAAVPQYLMPRVSVPTLLFALGVSVSSGVLFGLAPAFLRAGTSLSESLKTGGQKTVDGGTGGGVRVGGMLVTGQVALAFMLFIGAGLLTKSLARRLAIEPGFESAGVVTAQVVLPRTRYDRVTRTAFSQRLERTLLDRPSVRAASISTDIPLGTSSSARFVTFDDDPELAGRDYRVYLHGVSPGYLDTFRIPLASGRAFGPGDAGDSPPVVIVSQRMADRFWPGRSPLGKRVDGSEIVGVAADVKYRALVADPVNVPNDPDVLYPLWQRPSTLLNIAIRGTGGPRVLESIIRDEVRGLDGTLPVFAATTMDDVIEGQVAANRAVTRQLGAFAIIALGLAVAGLYGVLAYHVRRRVSEIGVRMALGAGRGRILSMVLRQGLALVATGIVAGLAGAASLGHVLASQLYDVATVDPQTYGIVSLAFFAVGVLACLVPARSATSIDPLIALRRE